MTSESSTSDTPGSMLDILATACREELMRKQAFDHEIFPDYLKPIYERYLREFRGKYDGNLTTVNMKSIRSMCTVLTLHPTRFRVSTQEAAQYCGLSEETLHAASHDVRTTLPLWRNIFVEESTAFLVSRDDYIKRECPKVREFVQSLNIESLIRTHEFPLHVLSKSIYRLFRKRHPFQAQVTPSSSGSRNSAQNEHAIDQHELAFSLMVKHYAKNLERESVVVKVRPNWCPIDPAVTPGTTKPQIQLLQEGKDSIHEYAQKLHSPAITEELANDLFLYYSAVHSFISKDRPHANLPSIYLACLYLAEQSHGTTINCDDVALITGGPVSLLLKGIEEFECLFPKFRFFKTAVCNNPEAIRAFAERLRFNEEQVVATQKLSSELTRNYKSYYFVTRAATTIYIKALEYGRCEINMRRIAPILTFAHRKSFVDFVKVVYRDIPDLKPSNNQSV